MWITAASLVIGLLTILWNRAQKRSQERWEQWGLELQKQFVIEEGPVPLDDDEYTFSIRIRSTCERPLHVGWVRLVKDAAVPSALAGLLSPETNSTVDERNLDLALEPNGSFTLQLTRRDSLDGTDGIGRITVNIDEPPIPNWWPVPLVVQVPLAAGEAVPGSSVPEH